MIRTLEKSWLYVSILLILALVAALLFWKSATRWIAIVLIGLSIIAALVFATAKHVRARRQGLITLPVMWRNILVDGLGVLLSMAAVILVAGKVAGTVTQYASNSWGVTAGILAALAVGLVVGFGVNLLVRWVWGLLTRPRGTRSAGEMN
jgi:hypothetical protein